MSISKEYFDKYFNYQRDKIIEESSSTIFEGITPDVIDNIKENEYNNFKNSNYFEEFLENSSEYKKIQIVNNFLIEETYSNLFTKVKYNMINNNGMGGELSFNEKFIIENTESMFKVRDKVLPSLLLENSDTTKEFELIEEGLGTFLSTNISRAVIAGSIALMGMPVIGLATYALMSALSLWLLPSASSREMDKSAKESLGTVGSLLFGTKGLLYLLGQKLDNTDRLNKFNASDKLIGEFDNISNDKELIKLLTKLSKSPSVKTSESELIGMLTSVFSEGCSGNFPDEFGNISTNKKIDPQGMNVIKKATMAFKSSLDDSDSDYNQYLEQRKCIINKLVEFYKMIAISNLSVVKNSKKIGNILRAGNYKDPSQQLELYNLRDDDDINEVIKENIKNVFKLRLYFDDLLKLFKRGMFDSDKEAGKYFEEKIKVADREIADQLGRSTYHPLGKAYEEDEDNASKDNEEEESLKKRKLFGFNTK